MSIAGFLAKRPSSTDAICSSSSSSTDAIRLSSSATTAAAPTFDSAEAHSLAAALAKRTKNPTAAPSTVTTTFMTRDGASWYVLARGFLPPPSREAFDQEWALHPDTYHSLKLYGRVVYETRWSQSWGKPYRYSGSIAAARDIAESTVLAGLLADVNEIHNEVASSKGEGQGNGKKEEGAQGGGGEGEEENDEDGSSTSSLLLPPYNSCLQNWYMPEHRIGLHSDDEKSHVPGLAIYSLSWGGERRFLFRARDDSPSEPLEKVHELRLRDGDLLVMGGAIQATHKHEVPKLRKTMDPPTSPRINWTIRAFK